MSVSENFIEKYEEYESFKNYEDMNNYLEDLIKRRRIDLKVTSTTNLNENLPIKKESRLGSYISAINPRKEISAKRVFESKKIIVAFFKAL